MMKFDKPDALDKANTANALPATPRSWHRKTRDWFAARVVELTLTAMVLLTIMVVLSPHVIRTVPAGHVGVLWKRFQQGTVIDTTFAEGTHFILPWNKLVVYDLRMRLGEMTVDTLMADGLAISVKVGYRFRLIPGNVGHLHQRVGPRFLETLLAPDIAAETRSVLGEVKAEDMYSEKRSELERRVREVVSDNVNEVSDSVEPKTKLELLHLEDVLISSIVLPPTVRQAIEHKNEQKQRVEEYAFRIKVEELERNRKEIEAQGIRRFQEVVSGTLTNGYLRLRGIDATMQLAQSENSKVVVVGGGESGMPLILGGMDNAPSTTHTDKGGLPKAKQSGIISRPAGDSGKPLAGAAPLAPSSPARK
ncbi:prohibitin family protein [Janthinobacterium sp. PC23-8]|uniref:prohibitin family protein n=1 Tax=Janthinobacterium sp. PC23-8 TaxID=2012679 RepID=UPI000B97443E|nr:prohibitin family protein [Janthinobacterium sp. PC23-8]OYO30329.1 hypothetical protein CD932_03655 [Janthinobacterium sp. PC23-8]